MKIYINFLKIFIAPLLIIFLFSNVKAEPSSSAFLGSLSILQNDSLVSKSSEEKYQIAKRLFENGAESKALELSYSLLGVDDEHILMKANYLLGKVFQKNNSKDVALKYTRKSLFFLNKIKANSVDGFNFKYQKIESENLRFLGKLYFLKEKKDSSLYYLNKLIKLKSIDNDVLYNKANGYNTLYVISFNEKKYKEAKRFLDKAISIFESINNEQDLSMAYINLASYYEVEGSGEKALKTYFKALPYIEHKNDAKSLEYKETLYYNIAWTMYNLKDYKAYEYLERSYDLKDSLINVNLRKELKKIERTHNIDLIRKEEENKREELKKNNWFIGITGALISLLFLYIANLYKLKQKNLKLQLSKKELEQQRRLDKLKSESNSKIINATIDGKEAERKMIAETLHDNVSALLSSAKLHLKATKNQIKGNLPSDLEKTQQIILEASNIVRDLSHNLVSSILLKFGLANAVRDTAKKFSNSTITISTEITEVNRYEQEFEIKVHNIIQEFINNVLKHSKATKAHIALEEDEDGNLIIIVEDNGCGFDVKKAESSGIGLNQIIARVNNMNGDFSVESSSEGTKIMTIIPVIRKQQTETNLA